jgi:hypothetical protein
MVLVLVALAGKSGKMTLTEVAPELGTVIESVSITVPVPLLTATVAWVRPGSMRLWSRWSCITITICPDEALTSV